eukprot:GILJ01025491.1.p1 GENE.GILJ01025491.1~~GILJ01025491.1.p1  ORF type:complete len:335 (+),score=40.48 GILJ01025491.1:82-1086(+)
MQPSPPDQGAGYYTHSPYHQINNASFNSTRQSSQHPNSGSFHPPYNSFGSQNEGYGSSTSPQEKRRLSNGPYYVGSDNIASTQFAINAHSFRSTPIVTRLGDDLDVDAQTQANAMSVSSNTSSARARKRRVSNTKNLLTVSTNKEAHSQSGDSSASSVLDNLPLCTADSNCTLINDKTHQYKFAHTCRLFPCYHGHIKRHAKLFRHAPGQIASTTNERSSPLALASVTFASISPDAPNATKVTVSSQDVAYDIFGDWTQVKVHTFKRYLHQVFGVEPKEQILSLGGKLPMDDDLEVVQAYINKNPSAGIVLTSGGSSVSERERQKMREALVDEL